MSALARSLRLIAQGRSLSALAVPILDDAADRLEKYERALRTLGDDEWANSDLHNPHVERVQSIAREALK